MEQENIFCINGMQLDQYQKNIVLDDSNALLVIAGAGSGKTFTILGKIKYLIERLNYKPNDILCISLTNDTVNNLKNKLENLGYKIDVYTFHKLGFKILNNVNKYSIIHSDYLNFIIDEYFLSYIYFDKKRKRTFLKLLKISKFDNLTINKNYLDLKKIIITGIHLIKNNNIDFNKLVIKYSKMFFKKNIFKYILDIFLIYKRELESLNMVDFDDMINLASLFLENNKLNFNYKYIIIDEYQDTSLSRYNLIKNISNQCSAKIMAVGDDWQSIYRFTGCDLNLFLDFKKLFKNGKVMSINNTYRNSKELIFIASNFIMRNKNQLKKELVSFKNNLKPIKIFYENNKNDLQKLIEYINSDDILILGRNNYDIKKYNIKSNINYLTVHKSKGLEADEVILINLENKIDGFPNKKKNVKVLEKIKKNIVEFPYDEERRLFYVALTRTKNSIYLLINKNNKSVFVNELIDDYKKYIEFIK